MTDLYFDIRVLGGRDFNCEAWAPVSSIMVSLVPAKGHAVQYTLYLRDATLYLCIPGSAPTPLSCPTPRPDLHFFDSESELLLTFKRLWSAANPTTVTPFDDLDLQYLSRRAALLGIRSFNLLPAVRAPTLPPAPRLRPPPLYEIL